MPLKNCKSTLPDLKPTLWRTFLVMLLATTFCPMTAVIAQPDNPDSGFIAKSGTDSALDPATPLVVGPRELVGKPGLGEKVAAGAMGGLMGSVLGGSGKKSRLPKTLRDPSRKLDYQQYESEPSEIETRVRGQWGKDGLLISSRIQESPGKGTFQAIFLESCNGQRLYPQRFEIYDLWNESSLSVSWSQTSTSNGQVTSQQSGGLNSDAGEGWSDQFSGVKSVAADGSTTIPGTWQQLGFDRAQGGVRQIGAYFDLSPEQLAGLGETALIVHSTRPLQDPVVTSAAQWLITPGDALRPQIHAATAAQRWQFSSAVCGQQGGLLLASATPVTLAASGAANSAAGAAAKDATRTGLDLPEGIQIVSAKGTGQTTGHIANLTLANNGQQPISLPPLEFYIPSDGKYQSYVGRSGPVPAIPPGSTQTIPVTGYCADVHRPPVPAGDDLPSPANWVVPGGTVDDIVVPPAAGAAAPGRALVPGTDRALPRAVDGDLEPMLAAPLLLAAMREIEQKTAELQASGDLNTPFSGNQDREREAVIQQTMWIYVAELEGEPYTREEFTERLEQQYEDRSGVAIGAAPVEDQQRVQKGADDFWNAFELVGVEAKVLARNEIPDPPTAGQDINEEKVPAAPGPKVPAEVVKDDCPAEEHIHHSPRQVNVSIANSYGDADSRKKISDGIRAAVESQESAYVTSTPPSTAYAIWRDDAIGGISSAYAKSVFLEKNKQDWVWTTDPLKTEAKGSGTHTLSFKPGPQCKATVAGAGLMWIKSSSEAFDPLQRNIEVFRALDAVKELSVEFVTRKLPPGIDDAIEAGVEAITDPASDTYAAASGNAMLVVGGQSDGGVSANRVVYKRKDKEDKAIIGGGATVRKFFASDVRPNSLTSKIDAGVTMEAGATGNGFAKAYLESVYGTLLVGVCECPESISVKFLTDLQMFIRTDAAKGAVTVALNDMKAAVDRINKDIQSGAQEIDGPALKRRVEAELRKWGDGTAGERFRPAEPRSIDDQ